MGKSLEWPFKDPKFIFFTDFDGTITLQDSNDYMTDTIGFGKEIREGLNRDILDGKITFRDAFRQMMDSMKKPFPECVEYLVKNIKLDPHFNEYYQWALKNQIPTVIVSSGMQPIIRAVLKNLVGDDADKLTIVCNEPEALSTSVRLFSTLATMCPICQLLARPIYFLPRRDAISSNTVRVKRYLSLSSRTGRPSLPLCRILSLVRRVSSRPLMKATRHTRKAELG